MVNKMYCRIQKAYITNLRAGVSCKPVNGCTNMFAFYLFIFVFPHGHFYSKSSRDDQCCVTYSRLRNLARGSNKKSRGVSGQTLDFDGSRGDAVSPSSVDDSGDKGLYSGRKVLLIT
jgi:hypothetical protein